jgi:hypothetical protein
MEGVRPAGLVLLTVILSSVAANCGHLTNGDDDTANGGADAGPLPDGEAPPWCPEWSEVYGPDHYCAWTTFLAPGPSGSAELLAWTCEIPIPEPTNPKANLNEPLLAVDCERFPYADEADSSQPEESWHYNDLNAPTMAVVSETLCEALRRTGFGRIDLLFACWGADPI